MGTPAADPFDDAEFRAALAEAGIVHKPGMAERLLGELAPLLADEGIDLDNLGPDVGEEDINAALASATERYNFELFTPVGDNRAGALQVLREFAVALAAGDWVALQDVADSVQPEPTADRPGASHVIGTSLGLLDDWYTDPKRRAALSATRLSQWSKPARTAAVDILAVARRGEAFGSLDALVIRHGGLALYQGGLMVVAAAIAASAKHDGFTVPTMATAMLSGAATSPSAAGHSPQVDDLPELDATGEAILRDFSGWMNDHPDAIAAPDVESEASVFAGMLRMAAVMGFPLDEPGNIEALVESLLDAQDDEGDDMVYTLVSVLDDYLHFRFDTDPDLERWDEAHEAVEAVLGAIDNQGFLNDVMMEAAEIPASDLVQAYADNPLVRATAELLDWIGPGRGVTGTGGIRRVDIEYVAGLLGMTAVGQAKVPSPEEQAEHPGLRYARSMNDIPLLAAWWETLRILEITDVQPTRVYVGDKAKGFAAIADRETVEMFIGVFVAEHATRLPIASAEVEMEVALSMIALLTSALGDGEEDGGIDLIRTMPGRFFRQDKIDDFTNLGIVKYNGTRHVVPRELRGVIARSIVVAMNFLQALEG